jgi:hypothetical protein
MKKASNCHRALSFDILWNSASNWVLSVAGPRLGRCDRLEATGPGSHRDLQIGIAGMIAAAQEMVRDSGRWISKGWWWLWHRLSSVLKSVILWDSMRFWWFCEALKAENLFSFDEYIKVKPMKLAAGNDRCHALRWACTERSACIALVVQSSSTLRAGGAWRQSTDRRRTASEKRPMIMQTRRMELMGLQEVDWKESEMINKSEIGEWFGAFTSTNMIETRGKITTMQVVLLSKLLAFTVFLHAHYRLKASVFLRTFHEWLSHQSKVRCSTPSAYITHYMYYAHTHTYIHTHIYTYILYIYIIYLWYT